LGTLSSRSFNKAIPVIWVTVISFLFFTALVGFLTWRITRNDDHESTSGYFLGGRSLTYPLIAGSLLLTNLSTEQMVGLNGAAFTDGLCVMVWEVVCVVALVFMAWFFLPRFLKSGVATVPQYLEIRFDHQTQVITNIIFLLAYVGILLPIILYTGATGMVGILDVPKMLGSLPETFNVDSGTFSLWLIVWMTGIIGSIYALFGGLRTVAVSDTLNGVGLLTGGFLITGYALSQLGGDGGISAGASRLLAEQSERFNSVGGASSSVPFGTIFSGIFLLNLFYWTTNQQIIQRTFGASSLAEGQKGVLLTGALKLLGPLYLVVPGMIAYSVFAGDSIKPDQAYGMLVNRVLPAPLTGFFAAAMIGAILSSFNSALNSSCTLFSLGLYKGVINPDASEESVVRSGKIFGWIVAVVAMAIAPLLANTTSIFGYLQKMNGIYFIPIFAVVLIGMVSKRVPPIAAKIALLAGFSVIAIGYFVPPFDTIVAAMHEFQFLGVVFAWLVILMLVIGEVSPRETEFEQVDVGAVNMTPWKFAKPAGLALIAIVFAIYATFADFSVLRPAQDKTFAGIKLYNLQNKSGMSVNVTNYGAIITSIIVPDRDGKLQDVALGYQRAEDYMNAVDKPYFGAIVGRYGNRIANGEFSTDGKTFKLAKNNGDNHLHGGVIGFDKVIWDANVIEPGKAIELSYLAKDREEGYPGNLQVKVTYRLTDENELIVDYDASTDKTTPVNLTQHTYFNLKGEGEGTILDHELTLHAKRFTPVDEGLIPTGELREVADTPFDFTSAKPIGRDINQGDQQLQFGGGYDHNWVLDKDNSNELTLAAEVFEPGSGRVLEVRTTEPGIQFYGGNFLDGRLTGKAGKPYVHRGGFCLETQHFPDSPNQPTFPSTLLEPNKTYQTTTVFRFSTKP
jgi:SSS family solute:Na+ symporter